MASDFYKVEVLHYLNPHLIWVEVIDKNIAKRDEFIFEQIGIYGLLPLETFIDVAEENLKSQRCKEWVPAAKLLMKKFLSDAAEVYFSPVFIDRRNSIFDDNIHKYGDLIITKSNGKQKKLSKLLVKAGLALEDECLFHTELHLGNLKTKLNTIKTTEVMSQLQKYYTKKENRPKKEWEKSVKKQMTVFHTAQHLESALTTKNLEMHNMEESKLDVEDLLQKKLKDLQMCKDVDDQSIGRACHKVSEVKQEISSKILKKRLQLMRNTPKTVPKKSQDVKDIISATKQFLEANATVKNDSSVTGVSIAADKDRNIQEVKHEKDKLRNNEIDEPAQLDMNEEDKFASKDLINKFRSKKAMPPTSGKIPEYDIRTQRRIAIGPPDTDKTKLVLKIVPKEIYNEPVAVRLDVEEEIPKKDDMFGEVDSDIDIEITNQVTLKKMQESVEKEENKKSVKDVSKTDTDDATRQESKVPNNIIVEQTLKKENNMSETLKEVVLKLEKIKDDVHILNKDVVDSRTENVVGNEVGISGPQKSPTISKPTKTMATFKTSSSFLKKKLQVHRESMQKRLDMSSSLSDTSNKDSSTSAEERPRKKTKDQIDSDDESVSEMLAKINLEYPPSKITPQKIEPISNSVPIKTEVNPFKNVDPNISVFVDKLVTPILMVHTKKNNCVRPSFELRDINFNTHIQVVLRNMAVERPMMLQTVSWGTILRGYSTFIVSPKGSGKTMGYLPAVCRLISDKNTDLYSVGPICIIVCATSKSVTEIERLSKIFLGPSEKVFACYSGVNELDLTTSLLNGCDLLICTPPILVRLLQLTDFGVDLRRLTTFVLDDCERTSEVYSNEIKFFFNKIKEMLKTRPIKELKVQYILASRIWCDFMEPLAKKVPDTVVCIGAFQECVLYSKANTIASFVTEEMKVDSVLDFLSQIDNSKKTVIVCRTDEEVLTLEKVLKKSKYIVYSCNNNMTVQDLYNLSLSWNDYQEPISGPILVCCDGNLTHMNVTDAHYLVHYSLPHLFSMFCKRFAVLNDNYASIFKEKNEDVKIKILLEDSNVEQLPKILHFIKRCTDNVPKVLDEVCDKVLAERDILKAKNLVPICDMFLALGECPDYWNCQERHAILKDYDKPKDWMPTEGIITFRILHYHYATLYSARLISNISKDQTTNYPQHYNNLTMKIATYFAKESNKKLHGIPKVGDLCAVSIKQNFFVRCQVVKILSLYQKGNPNYVLIKLIDEEKFEKTRDIYLYHLPEEMKKIETYVVHVRLANIQPKDKDITFSDLAKEQLKKITERDDELYLRGEIALTIGNCVLVDNLETCHDLSSMNKTVVRHNFKQELRDHAVPNPEHIPNLEKLCLDCDLIVKREPPVEVPKPLKVLPEGRWAHLEENELSPMFFASAENPGLFNICLVKFEECMNHLIKDIQKYVIEQTALTDFKTGDVILARFPDDGMYERARIDGINDDKAKCFFVDKGDWRDVATEYLYPITEKFITQLPFQAIECRLIGVKPAGEDWTEFGNNWFINCFEDNHGNLKELYVKYFTKEKALYTGGHRYAVAIIDTNTEKDILINKLMIEVNMARKKEDEIHYLDEINLIENNEDVSSESSSDNDWEIPKKKKTVKRDSPSEPLDGIFLKKPIRSVPLVGSDYDSEEDEKWNINMTDDFMAMFKPSAESKNDLPALESNVDQKSKTDDEITKAKQETMESKSDAESTKTSSISDIQIIPSPQKSIKTLDSDDLTSPENTQVYSNITQELELRKPKVLWRQTDNFVILKIQLTGVENYNIKIGDRSLKFEANHNDTRYGFEFDLYGVVDTQDCKHENKGQYILVNLKKIRKTKWLTLAKDGPRKWVVFDVDHIYASDEESEEENTFVNIPDVHESDSDSEEEFLDDVNFTYKR